MLEAEPPADIDDAIELAHLVRRRSRNERVCVLPAVAARIVDDPRVRTVDDPRVRHGGAHAAMHHGAGIGRAAQRDVDISARDADAFHSDLRANPNADDPNVVVRVVDMLIDGDDQFMPSIVAALDLLDAADTRAAEALRVAR